MLKNIESDYFRQSLLPSAWSLGNCWVSVNKLIKDYGLSLLNLCHEIFIYLFIYLMWTGAIQVKTDWLISANDQSKSAFIFLDKS